MLVRGRLATTTATTLLLANRTTSSSSSAAKNCGDVLFPRRQPLSGPRPQVRAAPLRYHLGQRNSLLLLSPTRGLCSAVCYGLRKRKLATSSSSAAAAMADCFPKVEICSDLKSCDFDGIVVVADKADALPFDDIKGPLKVGGETSLTRKKTGRFFCVTGRGRRGRGRGVRPVRGPGAVPAGQEDRLLRHGAHGQGLGRRQEVRSLQKKKIRPNVPYNCSTKKHFW